MNSGYYVDSYDYMDSGATTLLGGIAAFGIIIWLISFAVSILLLVSMWKVFKKCGKPGWASIIPIYNVYIMCEIAEKPWWYLLLFCVPFANIYAMFVIYDGVAKKLGKTTGFTIGMLLLPYIFWPILAFSKDTVSYDSTMVEEVSNSSDNSSVQGQTNASASVEPQQFNNIVQQPVNNFAQEPAAPVNNFVQEPALPVNNFAQEPAAPVNSFVQEPAAPVNNFVQEPAAPVNNFAKEPAAPVNNFAQEPAPTVNNFADEQSINNTNQAPTSLWSNNNNINNNQM